MPALQPARERCGKRLRIEVDRCCSGTAASSRHTVAMVTSLARVKRDAICRPSKGKLAFRVMHHGRWLRG